MHNLICPHCHTGNLRPVGDTAYSQRISHTDYEGRVTRLRCTRRPGCGKTVRFHGEFSLQILIGENIARNVKVCSADELRAIAHAAYLVSGSTAPALDWLRSCHISPEILQSGDAGEDIQQQLKDLLLKRISEMARKNIPAAPLAQLTGHHPSIVRNQRPFIYARAAA